jgi:hypothetical protein
MKNLDQTAKELFAKIRGRFPGVTIGNAEGNVTTEPSEARFFEFPFREGDDDLGKISVSLEEEEGLVIMFNKDVAENAVSKSKWYDFLKELRQFAKKRMLNFDTRDITKSNLEKRDYKYLANRPEDSNMNESKMYGTSKLSYQNIDNARLVIKHTESINQENAAGRTQKIGKIYIESADGERFMYPYKHLSGARAMARHVAEGGNPYDDFGKHITGLSEEMAKLRKFKTYMGRSAVMAESLAGYMDVVKGRITAVKKTIESLQKSAAYKEAVEGFEAPILEDVPSDVAENWIDQLTIKQFNEELKDVFPYIYKLVSEATKAQEIGADDLLDESGLQYYTGVKKHGKEYMKKAAEAGRKGASQEELGRLKDKYSKAEKKTKEEFELEQAFEDAMGQFSDEVCEDCGNPSWRTLDEEKQKGVDGKVCWKGYKRMGTKMKGGKRVDNCVKVKEGESEFDGHDIMSEDPPNGIDFDYANLSKVNWAQYSEEDIKTFYSIVDNLSFESGYYNDGEFDGSHAKALQWLEKNVMNKSKGDKDTDEGNAYAKAVRQAKMDGKKKGDKVKGPDGDEITIEKEQKTPLGEFILSYFDRETGDFPKGETSILTMVEKDYGEEFIEPAKAFIEQVNQTFVEFKQAEQVAPEFDRMRELAGLR